MEMIYNSYNIWNIFHAHLIVRELYNNLCMKKKK